jgi:hypothetical protein
MTSGLDIVSLPSHTSHALQPLDVSCFKPFKTAFRQIRDSSTLLNKGRNVEKQDLCEWTAKALKKSLSSTNIRSGFKKTGIWPFNPKAATKQMAFCREGAILAHTSASHRPKTMNCKD